MNAVGAALLLACMARWAMAVIFAASAWHGLRDVARFAGSVAGYRLLPDCMVMAAAWGIAVASAGAAALLVVAGGWGAAPGLALMLVFTAAIGINLRRGRTHIDCGCGGAGQRISAALLGRNLVLLAALAACGMAPAGRPVAFAEIAVTTGGAAALAALYFAAGQLLANRSLGAAAVS